MITCPICDNIYSEKRSHCPTCGALTDSQMCQSATYLGRDEYGDYCKPVWLVVAIGAERARQLPQSPRKFELVD